METTPLIIMLLINVICLLILFIYSRKHIMKLHDDWDTTHKRLWAHLDEHENNKDDSSRIS